MDNMKYHTIPSSDEMNHIQNEFNDMKHIHIQQQQQEQQQRQQQQQQQHQQQQQQQQHHVVDICDTSDITDHKYWNKEFSSDGFNNKIKYNEIEKEDSKTERKENTPKRIKIDMSDENNSRGGLGSAVGMRKIESYFAPNQGDNSTATVQASKLPSKTVSECEAITPTQEKSSSAANSHTSSDRTSNKDMSSLISSSMLNSAEWKKQNESLKLAKEKAEQKVLRLESELKSQFERHRLLEERSTKLCTALEDVYRLMAQQDMRRKRDRLAADCVRLGKIYTVRTSPTAIGEVWEEGYALKDLNARTSELVYRREELEKRRNRLKTTKKKHSAATKKMPDGIDEDEGCHGMSELDITTEESAVRMHMEQLRRDESALLEEKRLLESEKAAHQKELKLSMSADRSRFTKDLPCLHKRYLLLSLLGRGGFSEVWKALDLVELNEVAVKIHQLNPAWSQSRKQSYIKHVRREYTIHRDLDHPRVVKLFDVFEIDVNTFATVLELCRGTDLDEKLKTMKTLPEKDAKTIVMQIVAGLRYLNAPQDNTEVQGGGVQPAMPSRKRSIIHFDLKPANILFDNMGDVKITDFGLSKILEEADEQTSVELTSQGAGTYWYLPPECFGRGDSPPRISSKVDVWSLGVIFFQMLYGRRPFGEGKSQEKLLSEGIMRNATQVEFPQENNSKSSSSMLVSSNSPSGFQKVSEEAKDLIRACLTYDQQHRPDVMSICQHPYLRQSQKKS